MHYLDSLILVAFSISLYIQFSNFFSKYEDMIIYSVREHVKYGELNAARKNRSVPFGTPSHFTLDTTICDFY